LANRLSGLFVERNARVSWERRLDRVLERFETDTYDVLLATDTAFENGRVEGIEILEVIAAKSPVTQVLLLVAPKNIGLIGPALQAGTFLYTKLPVSDPELCLLVDTAVKQRPQFGVNELLKNAAAPVRFAELIGQSVPMQDVYRQIEQAAATDIPVLILGATGTGKDLVARAIHQRSGRRAAPFLAVNVGAIPVELVGSELFGHEKGAFTGAVARREGKFEQGNGGTLFLDEIGAIDEKIQVSLLRLLEHKKFHRLGGRQPITCDVRLIAATNADLTALVREGQFREDLFFRLDVFRISLPPLRERRGDIPLLLEAFMTRFNQVLQKNLRGIEPACEKLLEQYDWPGNIRELKNVIQRAVLICDKELIAPEHLPARFLAQQQKCPVASFAVGIPLDEMERQMIVLTLSFTQNNRTRAAQLLGISRRALYNRLEKYGIV
jgi:DNA-binding NtrC family response regulator